MTETNDLDSAYQMPVSPYKAELESSCLDILQNAAQHDSDYQRAVDDAMYLAVRKRMTKTAYQNDNQAYLIELLSNISNAEREFDQIAYTNSVSSSTFNQLKGLVLGLMSST